jgi:hypothetical protein
VAYPGGQPLVFFFQKNYAPIFKRDVPTALFCLKMEAAHFSVILLTSWWPTWRLATTHKYFHSYRRGIFKYISTLIFRISWENAGYYVNFGE